MSVPSRNFIFTSTRSFRIRSASRSFPRQATRSKSRSNSGPRPRRHCLCDRVRGGLGSRRKIVVRATHRRGCLLDPLHDEGTMRIKDGLAVPHLAGQDRAGRAVTLRPLHHRRHRNAKPLGKLCLEGVQRPSLYPSPPIFARRFSATLSKKPVVESQRWLSPTRRARSFVI